MRATAFSTEADNFLRGTEIVTYQNAANMRVTPELALRLSDVLACVSIVARAVGMLPLKVYQLEASGGKKVAPGHPLSDLFRYAPNPWQSAMEWLMMMQAHFELRGNAYSEVVPGPRGYVDQLIPLHPDRVKVRVLPNNRLLYIVTDFNGLKQRELQQEDVFHLRNLSLNGYVGLTTIEAASETVGAGLAAQDYSSRFFANDARPGFAIEGAKFKTDADYEKFRESVQSSQTGPNRHKAMVLPEGLSLKEVGVKNTDAQMLESRKYTRSQIAALFGVPLHMLGETEKVATYASVEQFAIQFVVYCIMPRIVAWEQAITRQLIIAPNVYFPKFTLNSLLRGDTASRFEAYSKAIQWGWMSPNDVRDLEEMNRVEGGDVYLQPTNYIIRGQQQVLAPATNPALPGKPTADTRFLPIVVAAADRCVRKEVAHLRKSGFSGVAAFYSEHANFITLATGLAPHWATAYCTFAQKKLTDFTSKHGVDALDQGITEWEAQAPRHLASLVMENQCNPM